MFLDSSSKAKSEELLASVPASHQSLAGLNGLLVHSVGNQKATGPEGHAMGFPAQI